MKQITDVCNFLKKYPQVKIIRGGAFKPRTNPYSFQGLGEEGLLYLSQEAKKINRLVVSEALSCEQVSQVGQYADILQVGSRNMYNYELLREIGKSKKPVILKRGFMATYREFIFAAEYIAKEGNPNIILCERGIRTFETETRNTLDISIIPILKKETSLPVIVDISHACGRKDILRPLAKASLACGANGIMVEIHPQPENALSDREQQINFNEFHHLAQEVNYELLH